MSFVSNAIMAFSMSTDAFAAAISKGAGSSRSPSIKEALYTGILFGVVESITPIIGWGVGVAASGFIAAIDHWIAFLVLGFVGIKMIFASFDNKCCPLGLPLKPATKPGMLLLTAIGTSIDALVVGISLAFVNTNILVIAGAIGFATFLMVTIGMLAGQYLGTKVGRVAEGLGGLGLIFIGTDILLTHLGLL